MKTTLRAYRQSRVVLLIEITDTPFRDEGFVAGRHTGSIGRNDADLSLFKKLFLPAYDAIYQS